MTSAFGIQSKPDMDSSTTQFLCHLPDRTLDEDRRNFRSSPDFRRSLKMEQSAIDDDQPGSDVIGRPEVAYRTSDVDNSRDVSRDCDELATFASSSPSVEAEMELPVDEAQFYAAARYGSVEQTGGPVDPHSSPGVPGGSSPQEEVATPSSAYPDKEERVLEEIPSPYDGAPLTNGYITNMDGGSGNSPPLGNSPNRVRVLYGGQHGCHSGQYVETSDRRFQYTEDEQMEAEERAAEEGGERMQRADLVGRECQPSNGLEAKRELDEAIREIRYNQEAEFAKGNEFILKEDNAESGGRGGGETGGGGHLADVTASNGHTFQVKVTGSAGLGYSVIYPVHSGQHLLPSEDVENFFTSLEKPVPLQATMAEPSPPGLTTPSTMDEASSLTLLEKASFNQQGLSIQGDYPSYLQQPQTPSQQQQQQGAYYNYATPYNMTSFPPQGYPGTFCDPASSYGLSTAQSQTFKTLHQTIPPGYQTVPVDDHRSSSLLSVLGGTSGLNITLGGPRTTSNAQLTALPLKVPATSSSSISSSSCVNGTVQAESITAAARYYSNGRSPERQGLFIDDKGALCQGAMTPLGSPDGGVYYGALPYDLGPSHDGMGGAGWETARLTASLLSYSSPDEMRINGTGMRAQYNWLVLFCYANVNRKR